MRTFLIFLVGLFACVPCPAQFGSLNDLAFLSRRPVSTLPNPTMTNTVGLVLWLKPESLPAHSNTVPTWTDSSGSGNHLSGNSSTIVAANALNGFKAVQMTTLALFERGSVVTVGTNNTLIAVLRDANPDCCSFTRFMGLSDTNAGPTFNWLISNNRHGTNAHYLTISSAGGSYSAGAGTNMAAAISDFSYLEWTRSDSAPVASFFQNATSLGVWPDSPGLIGGIESQWEVIQTERDLQIVEVLMWDRAITSDDRLGMRIYFADKYGL